MNDIAKVLKRSVAQIESTLSFAEFMMARKGTELLNE
jgi:hypothetical protein